MGRAKEQMLQREGHIEWAKSLLLDSGSLHECEVHGYLMDNLAGEEVFEEAVTVALVNPPTGYSPQDVRELLQEAVDDTAVECPGCHSNARDD